MELFKIDIGEIAELGTQIAVNGAIQASYGGDEMFEYIVAIAVLIYEMFPR